MSLGCRTEEWSKLADALRAHARANAVVSVVESQFGKRFAIDGGLATPDNRVPAARVRTVWIVEPSNPFPRPITAHPIAR